MKTKIFTLCFALVASVGTMFAESGTCGKNLTWDLTDSVLTISGTGAMYDFRSDSPAPWYSDYNKYIIKSVTIGNGVTSIGDYAFEGCSNLTSATIPNSVTSIGSAVFASCKRLTSVSIPNGVTNIEYATFSDCSRLTSVTIPSSVISIGDWAFNGCASLTSIAIPNSVTSIGDDAFRGCKNLISADIPNSVTSIGELAFLGCTGLTSVTIGNGVTSIGRRAFDYCTGLTSVTIGNGVTSIGNEAFHECYGLTFVTIPNSVTSIGRRAFCYCTSLTSVTIPSSVTSIGDGAFSYCTSLPIVDNIRYADTYLVEAVDKTLSTYTIVEDTRFIGDNAFYSCPGLTSITFIPNSVTSIGSGAFASCDGLTSITIPNSVTEIGEGAFSGCAGLKSIVWNAKNCADIMGYDDGWFPNSNSAVTSFIFGNEVEHIPAYLCVGMNNLASITIPNSVTSIGENTFYYTGLTSVIWNAKNCVVYDDCFPESVISVTFGNKVEQIPAYLCNGLSRLTSIVIPNSVKSIGKLAFGDCTGLTSVTCMAVTPPAAGDVFMFVECRNTPLYVPARSVNAYKKADEWKDFNPILPINGEGENEGAEEIETSEVTATPTEEGSVILEWPAVDGAATYAITIFKNGELVCSLTFDAEGHLISVAFSAPSRDNNGRNVPMAEQAAKGWRYEVKGLEAGAEYTYTITAKKEDESVLFTQSIDFTMPAPQGLNDVESGVKAHKLLREGQLFILRGDKTYTLQGQEVK